MMAELNDLDEVRLLALDHLVAKKKRVERTYNKNIRLKSFMIGNLVWKVILSIGYKVHHLGKWSPN